MTALLMKRTRMRVLVALWLLLVAGSKSFETRDLSRLVDSSKSEKRRSRSNNSSNSNSDSNNRTQTTRWRITWIPLPLRLRRLEQLRLIVTRAPLWQVERLDRSPRKGDDLSSPIYSSLMNKKRRKIVVISNSKLAHLLNVYMQSLPRARRPIVHLCWNSSI